jgi:ubiquinone/menaquinone biosynthesis C-methylase UbiE
MLHTNLTPLLADCHARADSIRAIAALDPRSSDHVLQLACGKGLGIELMFPMLPAGTITGVDSSAQHIAEARSRNHRTLATGRVMIEQVNPGILPFEDDTFDAVFAADAFACWVKHATRLDEVARVLRPGGRLVLASPLDAGGKAAMVIVAQLARTGFERIAMVPRSGNRHLGLIAARTPEAAMVADPWPLLRLAG